MIANGKSPGSLASKNMASSPFGLTTSLRDDSASRYANTCSGGKSAGKRKSSQLRKASLALNSFKSTNKNNFESGTAIKEIQA